MERVELHRVRLDTLLWCLEGFAQDGGSNLAHPKYLSDRQRAVLLRMARRPRCGYGELDRLAQLWDRDSKSLAAQLVRLRRCLRVGVMLPTYRGVA